MGALPLFHIFSNGSKKLPKEYLEVFGSGIVAVLDDFKKMAIYETEKVQNYREKKQNKGYADEVKLYLMSIKNGGSSPIPVDDLFHVTSVIFKIKESLQSTAAQTV